LQVIQRKPYDNFIQSIGNPETRREYVAGLKRFLVYFKIGKWEKLEQLQLKESEPLIRDSSEDLLKLSPQQLEDTLIEYVVFMKKNDRSEGLITQQIASVRKFLITNRINLNWEFINQYKGEFKRKQRDESYTHEQIQRLLDISKYRTKVLVLIFASTGARVGAIPDLKKKHLKRIGDLYQFTFYEGYREEYITFCTPECAKAIDDYLAYRERAGEVITDESYLIR
jgi:integrase